MQTAPDAFEQLLYTLSCGGEPLTPERVATVLPELLETFIRVKLIPRTQLTFVPAIAKGVVNWSFCLAVSALAHTSLATAVPGPSTLTATPDSDDDFGDFGQSNGSTGAVVNCPPIGVSVTSAPAAAAGFASQSMVLREATGRAVRAYMTQWAEKCQSRGVVVPHELWSAVAVDLASLGLVVSKLPLVATTTMTQWLCLGALVAFGMLPLFATRL